MIPLPEQIAKCIRERDLLRTKQPLLVAVSGGLDSMCLLEILHRLAPGENWKLTVAHFNHQLRGADSDADEKLVADTAARLRLPFVSERGDVRRRMADGNISLEMAARELRHEFLGRSAERLKISTIATAHHADDQVELFFLRLLRGAGGEGIGGMKWISPAPFHPGIQLIRPLLGVRRAELEHFVREHGVAYREDATNASRELLRNRVRHELIPSLTRNFDESLISTVARTMEITAAECAFAEETARAWLKARTRSFDKLHLAVQRQCVRLQLIDLKIEPAFALVERLRQSPGQLISGDSSGEIYRDKAGSVIRKGAVKAFDTEKLEAAIRGDTGQLELGGRVIRWRLGKKSGDQIAKRKSGLEYFDADKIGESIHLRHWQKGDRFHPIGMKKDVKLQDLLTNQKIPRDKRRELLIATSAEGQIFWVEGLRISELFKLTPQTRRRLEWSWEH